MQHSTPIVRVSANDSAFKTGRKKLETVAHINPAVRMELQGATLTIPVVLYIAFPFLALPASRRTIKRLLEYLKRCKMYDGKQRKWRGRPGMTDLRTIEIQMAQWLEAISTTSHAYLAAKKRRVFGMSYHYFHQNLHLPLLQYQTGVSSFLVPGPVIITKLHFTMRSACANRT